MPKRKKERSHRIEFFSQYKIWLKLQLYIDFLDCIKVNYIIIYFIYYYILLYYI